MAPVPVARTNNEQSAQLLCAFLEARGVESVVVGGSVSNLLGGLVFSAEVHVAASDVELARFQIQELMETGMPERCLACGYDFEGLTEGTECPECGADPSPHALPIELIAESGSNGLAWIVVIVVSGIALAGVVHWLVNLP